MFAPIRFAVSSSWLFMRNPPSPHSATTLRSGWTSLAAIAPGMAMPMAAKPFEMITVFGSYAWYSRATQTLCAPTSDTTMSDGTQRAAQVADRPLRRDRPGVGRLVRRELVEQLGTQVGVDQDLARCVPLGRIAPADAKRQDRVEQPPKRPVDVADQLDLGAVGGVDLRRLGVDVDDPLGTVRVPRRWCVLHQVVPDADDEVGPIEARQDVVARLEPDGHQREVRPVVDRALAHERRRDRDMQAARQRPEFRRGAAAQDAVAGQDDRPFRRGDEARRVGDGLVGRARGSRHAPASAARARGRSGEKVAAAMSSGSSMWVGPGFSSVATRNALRTISGMSSACPTRVFHFVTGSSMRTMSTTWCASLWSFEDAAWPVIATIGARSRNASATPVMRFVAPGPRVAIATAARPVRRPWTSAMNAAPCSWRVVTWRTPS